VHEIELRYLGRVWTVSCAADPFPMSAERGYGVSPSHEASLTAMATALMRAAHTRLDPQPLIDDLWGDRLVPDLARASFRDGAVAKADPYVLATSTPEAILDAALVSAPGYTNVVARARFTEDTLREAVGRDIGQYVIIGAGLDSFALRRPVFAERLQVFEVDQHPTQAFKRQRFAECGLTVPASLHFVPADLSREDLAMVLARSGYQRGIPSFFAWLGVTMFLTRAANLATLRSIAGCSAPGSELVFTYLDERVFQSKSPAFLDLQESVRNLGEPFRSGFNPGRLAEDLREVGFELLQDLTESQLVRKLAHQESKFLVPMEHSHIAHARVARR
jgi:methyltransferase (TIGR00027 family)